MHADRCQAIREKRIAEWHHDSLAERKRNTAELMQMEVDVQTRKHEATLAAHRKMLEEFEEALPAARSKKDVRRKYEGNPQTFERKDTSELFRFGRVVSVNRFVHNYTSKRPSVSTEYAMAKYKRALHKIFRK